MATKTPTFSLSFGFHHVLALVFITLKLCHVIDWSWWWVTLPLWVWFPVLGGLFLIIKICDFFIK